MDGGKRRIYPAEKKKEADGKEERGNKTPPLCGREGEFLFDI